MIEIPSLACADPSGVIWLDSGFHFASADDKARSLLRIHFSESSSHGELPPILDRWVQCCGALSQCPLSGPTPTVPLHQAVFEHSGRRLIASLIIGEGQAPPRLVLREAVCRTGALAEVIRSLSQREKEVLTWLVEGKTNEECSHILGISSRTVEKHCEHIFGKLGVENRTGAIGLLLSCTHCGFLANYH